MTHTLVPSSTAATTGFGEIPSPVIVPNAVILISNAALPGEFFSQLSNFFFNNVSNVANVPNTFNVSTVANAANVGTVPVVAMVIAIPDVATLSSSPAVSMVTALPAVSMVTIVPAVSMLTTVPDVSNMPASNIANFTNVRSGDASSSNLLPSSSGLSIDKSSGVSETVIKD